MSIDEHKEFARKLDQIQALTGELLTGVAQRYGKTKRGAKIANRIFQDVANLKAELEDCMYEENPGVREKRYVYYGKVKSNG